MHTLTLLHAHSRQVIDSFRAGGVDGHPSVIDIIAESKQLQEWQDLFELYVQVRTTRPLVTRCRGAHAAQPGTVCLRLQLRTL